MITVENIYNSLVSKLKTQYPAYGIYGQEWKEDGVKPAFLISIYPKNISMENPRYKKFTYSIMITYLQNEFDFSDNMKKMEELQGLFGMNLSVADRVLTIADYHFSYTGDKSNILQFSFDMEFLQRNDIKDENEPMSEMVLNNKMK